MPRTRESSCAGKKRKILVGVELAFEYLKRTRAKE
jgi:hypothetical protein